MDGRTQRIRQIGHATRFKAGNRCSPGRPRTAKFANWIKRLGKQWGTEPGALTQWEQFTRTCFREALNGSAAHAQLLAKYAGPDLWKETQQVVKEILEDPAREWLLRRRPLSRRVPGLSKSGSKRQEDCLKSGFSYTQDAPPQIQAVPHTVPAIHELARELVGIADGPVNQQVPAKRRVKVQLW